MNVRLAIPEDHPWISAKYEQEGFLACNYHRDTVAVAEIDGKKAGAGRLCPVSDAEVELGGIYVEERYRGHGVAKAVIDFLIGKAEGKTIYCIPFAHLVSLYREIGFQEIGESDVPAEVRDKYEWCRTRYSAGVGLLVRR